jgi:hypothetical protein
MLYDRSLDISATNFGEHIDAAMGHVHHVANSVAKGPIKEMLKFPPQQSGEIFMSRVDDEADDQQDHFEFPHPVLLHDDNV